MGEPDTLANEGWINNRWRPAMAWQYFLVCIFDFIIFPGTAQVISGITGNDHEWKSLTLQGGGLYHAAMGGIVGVAVWQRSQEKLAIMKADSGAYSESTHTIETVTSKDAKEPAKDPPPTSRAG